MSDSRKRKQSGDSDTASSAPPTKKQKPKTQQSSPNLKKDTLLCDEVTAWASGFRSDPRKRLGRNAVVTVGAKHACTDTDVKNRISHNFLVTAKGAHTKATDQGQSGRCWLFAGLNSIRHLTAEALGLKNCEFSQTFLFFWDKLNRADVFLKWAADQVVGSTEGPGKIDLEDRTSRHMLSDFLSDGGYWNCFTNLIDRYGVIPKKAMPETWQSVDSLDLNTVVRDRLVACAREMTDVGHQHENASLDTRERVLRKMRRDTLSTVFTALVTFLGQPPDTFEWYYTALNTDADPEGEKGDTREMTRSRNMMIMKPFETYAIKSTPAEFTQMCTGGLSFSDELIVLSNIPSLDEKDVVTPQKYSIKMTSNTVGGNDASMLNVPMSVLKEAVVRSVAVGMPVWFAGDVSRGFSYQHSALSNRLVDTSLIFGEPQSMTKGQKIAFRSLTANHAMTLTGMNQDEKGRPVSWQVENSWGFWDHETPGLDGFLCMDDEWFDECVFEVAVHRRFVSDAVIAIAQEKPVIELDPWHPMASALRVSGTAAPGSYHPGQKR